MRSMIEHLNILVIGKFLYRRFCALHIAELLTSQWGYLLPFRTRIQVGSVDTN